MAKAAKWTAEIIWDEMQGEKVVAKKTENKVVICLLGFEKKRKGGELKKVNPIRCLLSNEVKCKNEEEINLFLRRRKSDEKITFYSSG